MDWKKKNPRTTKKFKMHIPENSLAFYPQFDQGIKREDLIPLIDDILFDIKKTARANSNVHELIKASVPKATQLAGLEFDLAKQMTENFNKEAQKAFDNAMEEMQRRAAKKGLKQFTAKESNEFLGLLGKEFQDLDIGMQKQVIATMGAFYRFGRNTSVIGKAGFQPSFNLIDRQAQKFLERDTLFWVGEHYDSGIRNVVRETALNDMVRSGMGRKAAGRRLEENFASYIKQGIIPEGVTVPSGWTGSTQDYFTGLVANARNKATTYSRIFTYQQAGVETYEIVAVMDRRTSEICQFMNGKIFNVSWAADTVQQVVKADTPEETKDIVGWKRTPEAISIAGVTDPNQKLTPDQSLALHEAGLDLPPYHFRCRTTVVASSESELITTEEKEETSRIQAPAEETPRERRNRLRRERRAKEKEEVVAPGEETKRERRLRLRRERRARIREGKGNVVPKQGKVPKRPVPLPKIISPARSYKGHDPKKLRFKTSKELDTIYAKQISEFDKVTKGLPPLSEDFKKAFNKKLNELIDRSGGRAKEVRGIASSRFSLISRGKLRNKKAWDGRLFHNKHSTESRFKTKVKNFENKLSKYWTTQANETVVIDDVKIVQKKAWDRAFYRAKDKTVNVASNDTVSAFIHEFSHHIENSNKESIRLEVTRFLNRRTKGEKLTRLSDVFKSSGYEDWEVVRKDKFFDVYCGKVYKSGDTEILSMGMEKFVKSPSKFYREDPDYFSLILGFLRGEMTAPVPVP
jgi:SPP1 gp7 family putative phage head morphogenesis protein